MIPSNHCRYPQSRLKPAFTLVELLISISIIIILAGLLFVLTSRIRSNARQAHAVSAMRQIVIANVGYYSENNGVINVIRDASERGPYEGTGGRWVSDSFMGRMQPFLFPGIETTDQKQLAADLRASLSQLLDTTNLKTMAGTPFAGVPVTTDASAVPNPFAINERLRPKWGAANPPLRISSFGDPATVLYLTYGRYYFSPAMGQTYTPLPQGDDRRRTIYYLPNRKGFFAFLDGHVELLSPPIDERLFGERPPL
jgi:prepilin-type processing-associated H-X9-DG protein